MKNWTDIAAALERAEGWLATIAETLDLPPCTCSAGDKCDGCDALLARSVADDNLARLGPPSVPVARALEVKSRWWHTERHSPSVPWEECDVPSCAEDRRGLQAWAQAAQPAGERGMVERDG